MDSVTHPKIQRQMGHSASRRSERHGRTAVIVRGRWGVVAGNKSWAQ